MVSGSDAVRQLSRCSVMVTSWLPLVAGPGHVLERCTGDNQPSMARLGHVKGLLGRVSLGWVDI